MAALSKKSSFISADVLHVLLTTFILSGSLFIRGIKHKQDFAHITGPIVRLAPTLPGAPIRPGGDKRFLSVRGHSQVFELFIGKSPGDFSPAFEQLDQLKTGEVVTVYFDEELSDKLLGQPVNRLVQYIDKGRRPYFIRNSQAKYGGLAALLFSVGLSAATFLAWKKRRSAAAPSPTTSLA